MNFILGGIGMKLNEMISREKTTTKVVIVGAGWAGISAAVAASQAGAEVIVLERTDMLLGVLNAFVHYPIWMIKYSVTVGQEKATKKRLFNC